MNDYLGASHEAIYGMVKKGQPAQARAWAGKVSAVSRKIGVSVADLRQQLAELPDTWADGSGSVLLTADLGAVIDYLETLSEYLAGQPGSYADLVAEASADLAASQPPAVLPPPPVVTNTDYYSDRALVSRAVEDPMIKNEALAAIDQQIAQNNADRLQAGETATNLDNQYRTAIARLTPPPAPPPIVLDAGSAGGVEPVTAVAPVDEQGVSRPGVGPGPRVVSGWSAPSAPGSTDAYPGAGVYPSTGGYVPAAPAVGGALPGSGLSPIDWGGNGNSPGTDPGTTGSGLPGVGVRPFDSASVDPAVWDRAPHAGVVNVDGPGSANPDAVGDSYLGHAPATVGRAFDPVTGSVVTAGPAMFGAAGTDGGAGWGTAAGVAGIGALAAGAAYLSRSGGIGLTSPAGAGGIGGAGVGPAGINGITAGGNPGVAGPGGGSGSGMGGYGPGSAGARGMVPGAANGAANGMVQNGQIGQAGRAGGGTGAAGVGRPMAPGAVIGGGETGGYRVTWLVEDRDLYRTGPTVRPVIDGTDADQPTAHLPTPSVQERPEVNEPGQENG